MAEEVAEYSDPTPNPKHDLHHPPPLILNTSKSLDRRSKTTSQIAEKTESEKESHDKLRVLDQPDKWCIYRVPSKLRKVNEAAYTPQLLSIGLFHHGKPELKDMEGHKLMYYENFLVRCEKGKDDLKHFIKPHRENILRCYAGTIELKPVKPEDDPVVNIIVVDACFLIELFLTHLSGAENHENDYTLRSPWLRNAVEQDLILFENQLPYYFLQELYKFAMLDSSSFQPSKEVQAQEQAHGQSSTNHDLQYCKYCLPCSQRTPSNDHCIDIGKAEPSHDHPCFINITYDFFKHYSKGKSLRNGVKLWNFMRREFDILDCIEMSYNTMYKYIWKSKRKTSKEVRRDSSMGRQTTRQSAHA